ncbi:protein of unknown function [Paraburkholderia kururiensis]
MPNALRRPDYHFQTSPLLSLDFLLQASNTPFATHFQSPPRKSSQSCAYAHPCAGIPEPAR